MFELGTWNIPPWHLYVEVNAQVDYYRIHSCGRISWAHKVEHTSFEWEAKQTSIQLSPRGVWKVASKLLLIEWRLNLDMNSVSSKPLGSSVSLNQVGDLALKFPLRSQRVLCWMRSGSRIFKKLVKFSPEGSRPKWSKNVRSAMMVINLLVSPGTRGWLECPCSSLKC